MRMRCRSPRTTLPNQTLELAPISTSPITTAPGATHASGWMRGQHSPNGSTLPASTRSDVVAALVAEGREEVRVQIALAEARDDHDHELPLVLRSLRVLDRGRHVRAGRDPAEDPLLGGQAARHLEGGVVVDQDDLVEQLGVEHVRDEPRTQTLDLVLAGRLARDHGAVRRLDGDRLEARLARLDHLGHTGDRAPRPDAGDQGVDLSVGVAPDLLGGGAAMDLRV